MSAWTVTEVWLHLPPTCSLSAPKTWVVQWFRVVWKSCHTHPAAAQPRPYPSWYKPQPETARRCADTTRTPHLTRSFWTTPHLCTISGTEHPRYFLARCGSPTACIWQLGELTTRRNLQLTVCTSNPRLACPVYVGIRHCTLWTEFRYGDHRLHHVY